ncbi:MAG: hypothetical protein NTV81_00305 [Candidatus Komeilibacteria bacterium]|nr:hypothetical protein [Candidatus Komeilibacteria bacterium]
MTNSVSQNAYLEGVTVLTEDGQWKVWHRGQLVPLSGSTEPGGRPGLSTNKSLAAQPLHPTPPMVKKDTAAFYFYPEDEEDVAGLVLPDIGPQTEYSLTKIIQKLLAHYSLSLTEGTLLNLKNIVFVFLRGTRSPVATWELLQASLNTGGTNLAIGVSDTILGFGHG